VTTHHPEFNWKHMNLWRNTCIASSSYSSAFRVGFRVFQVVFWVFRVGFQVFLRVFRVGFRVFRVGSGCSGWGSGFYRHPFKHWSSVECDLQIFEFFVWIYQYFAQEKLYFAQEKLNFDWISDSKSC
jgi:hypothetical protein